MQAIKAADRTLEAETRRLRNEVEHAHGVTRNLQVDLAVSGIQIDWNETVSFLKAACVRSDRHRRIGTDRD